MKFDKEYKVLLVDNDSLTVKLLSNMLKQMGAICEIYENGIDAYKAVVGGRKYDVLLIRISAKDDYTEFPIISKVVKEAQIRIPIIGLTGGSSEETLLRIKRMGLYDVLVLPPSPQQLFKVIANSIQSFTAINHTYFGEIDEFLKVNYLDNISHLQAPQQHALRKLIEFTENNVAYLHNVVGVTLFSMVDDMRLLRRKIITQKWIEAKVVLTEMQVGLQIFANDDLIHKLEQLQRAIINSLDNPSHIIGAYNKLHTKLCHWIAEIHKGFDVASFNTLIISNTSGPAEDKPFAALQIEKKQPVGSVRLQMQEAHLQSKVGAEAIHKQSKGRILVADDDDAIAHIIDFRLKKEGYTTKLCSDGKAVVDILAAEPFDLLITDMMMPYYNGIEVISIIRNNLKLNIPILVLSAVENEKTTVEALLVGANDFITKPFSAQELIARVQKYVK